MEKIGLIAGWGELPMVIGTEARQKGHSVFAVGLEPLADKTLGDHVDDIEYVSLGKLGKIISILKEAGVEKVVMAGKVPKTLLYKSKMMPDLRAAKMLLALKDKKDDTILLAITNELKKDGLELLETTSFTESIMAKKGVMTTKKPTKNQKSDIEFGFPIAKQIGGLDIGQSVVVKDRAVMAIEAIEGTDEAIKRGGKLAADGAVVIKVAKPEQDLRFDVPGVGRQTILTMAEVQASVLALEAGACIIIDKANVIKEANELGICIVGVTSNK
jgi:DUF1009 family protein